MRGEGLCWKFNSDDDDADDYDDSDDNDNGDDEDYDDVNHYDDNPLMGDDDDHLTP